MQGSYGNFSFDNNAIVIGSRCSVLRNNGGEMYARLFQYDVEGYISGSSQSTITTAMNAVETALARPFQDFVFYHDDSTESAFTLDNNSSISGVTISDGPNWIKMDKGANFVNAMKFSFTVQAEYPLGNTNNLLLNFSETITTFGGGPKFAVKECLFTLPQRQQLRVATVFTATQAGVAVGYRKYPGVPAPRWPYALMESPRIDLKSPTLKGRDYEGYELSYQYNFASPSPLVGVPTLWT